MDAAGIPTGPVLEKAGLSAAQLDDPEHPVAVAAQIKLLQAGAEALGDDFLGFHLARDFELREAGLLYYVLSSANSFAGVLEIAQRYTRIVNEGVEVSGRTDRSATITLNYVNVERQSDRHQIEFWMVAIVRMCRQLTDARIAPLELKVKHFRDATPSEMRAFLGCDMTFGADADEIILPEHVNRLPIVGADRHLHELLIGYAEEALADRNAAPCDPRFPVERAIAPLLPHGKARATTVARELGVSNRRLARSLAQGGATFSTTLDQYRAKLAEAYLTHGDLSISQIAWLLGYGEVSGFRRAFKRWFGVAPEQIRAADRPA
jgi:AraC-like DNA-binding protein